MRRDGCIATHLLDRVIHEAVPAHPDRAVVDLLLLVLFGEVGLLDEARVRAVDGVPQNRDDLRLGHGFEYGLRAAVARQVGRAPLAGDHAVLHVLFGFDLRELLEVGLQLHRAGVALDLEVVVPVKEEDLLRLRLLDLRGAPESDSRMMETSGTNRINGLRAERGGASVDCPALETDQLFPFRY